MMPMDVELSELHASGAESVRADWSQIALTHMQRSLDQIMSDRNASTVKFVPSSDDPDPASDEVQIRKLFASVGGAVSLHHYVPGFQLPHKGEKFDWSLGPSVQLIKEKYDADYALFIFVRDSYATAGRAAAIAIAAVLGVGLQGGVQIGYAALVNTETGDIEWFNQLARASGDLRTAEKASETMAVLLTSFPE